MEVRNNSAECFMGTADGRSRAREVRRLEPQSRWSKDAVNNVIGVWWRVTDCRWIVERPETQVDLMPPPPVPFVGPRVEG